MMASSRMSRPATRRSRRVVLCLLLLGALLGLVGVPGSGGAAAKTPEQVRLAAENTPGAADALPVVTPAVACQQLAAMDLAALTGQPVSIGSAAVTTATPGGWEACDVRGVIAPQEQFQAFLPTTTWRQLYLQTGCGGFCGSVNISAPAAAGCAPLTAGQFVMASDNEGHYGTAAFDATFGADPELRADFGYRSEHKLAVFMKQLITTFYGKPAAYSFYDGCSQGGHEGLTEAQRFPGDFNGIVSGAPA